MSPGKSIPRIALALAATALVLLGTASIVVHTAAFNRFVLNKITQVAEHATGGRVQIDRAAIHWSHLGVDFYNVALYERAGLIPFFAADHLGVGVRIVSVLRRKIDLDTIVLDHPVIHFSVDALGNTNLPRSNVASTTIQPTSVFQLGIQNVRINSGAVYYANQRIPLSAELHDFELQIRSSLLSGDYKGMLSYDRGLLQSPGLAEIEHNTHLNFAANSNGLTLDSMNVSIGKTHIDANGQLSNYSAPDIRLGFNALVYADELSRIAKFSSGLSGNAAIDGILHYHFARNRTFLESLDVKGNVSSGGLKVSLDRALMDFTSVHAAYSVQNGNLDVHNLDANLLDGHLSGHFAMLHLDGAPESRLDASLRGVSVKSASDLTYDALHQRINLVGRADIGMEATWGKSVRSLMAHAHVIVRAPDQLTRGSSAIPVNGVVDVSYDAVADTASFGPSNLRTGETQITLSGTVSKRSNLMVQLNTQDLGEIGALASAIAGSTANHNLSDLRGSAGFTAQVSGAVTDPIIKGQLDAGNVQYAGVRWPALKAKVELSSSLLSLNDGYIESGQQGRATFDARLGLQKWTFSDTSPASINATLTHFSVAEIEHAANLHYPVTGMITAKLSLSGTERNPAGQGSLQLSQGSAWNEPIRALSADFNGDGKAIQLTSRLQISAGDVQVALTYSPAEHSYQAALNTAGLRLEAIQALQADHLDLSGTLSGSANGSGTIQSPQLTASFQIPTLQVRGQTISQVQADLEISREHANFTLNSIVSQGYVQAKAAISLAGEYPTTATLDVRALPLQLLLAAYVPTNVKFKGQTEIHATIEGPLKDPRKLVAHVQIPIISAEYDTFKLANVAPLNFDYSDGIVTLKRAELKGTGTDLTVEGEVPINGSGTLNISAQGALDVGILQGLGPETHSSGRVDLQLSARGALSQPVVNGSIRIENGAFSSASLPVGIEQLNGQIALSGNRADVQQLAGKAGGGDLSVRGSVIYGKSSIYNLALHANSVRLRPDGMRAVLNGDIQLNGNSSDSVVSGSVVVDRLSFTQGFDLANFAAQFSGPESVASPSALERSMKLNIAVRSSQDLSLASNQLSLEGAANLNVVGNLANTVLLGRISLSNGEVFFLGKRYQLQNGSIVFSNPARTEPNLNLFITTQVEQYNITLNLVGTLDRLRTSYVSEPALPTLDIINLIAFGQTTAEKQSSSANTTATMGAESVVAQGLSGQVAGRVAKAAGISQLTIDPLVGGSQNPGAQIAIQQRVTGNLLMTFSTDVTTTQSETVQLQYQLNPRWQVSVVRDQNGGYGIDLRLHKEF